jgi:8-oxo-dGTP diphosphatase
MSPLERDLLKAAMAMCQVKNLDEADKLLSIVKMMRRSEDQTLSMGLLSAVRNVLVSEDRPERTAYVLGFMIGIDKVHVVCIQKQKGPECIIGKFNGVGGKIEGDETIESAMSREYMEETGVFTDPNEWRCFARLYGYKAEVFCCVAFGSNIWGARTMEAEPISVRGIDTLLAKEDCVPNLKWMIPLALDKDLVYANVFDPTI